jgi:hypothetical protein
MPRPRLRRAARALLYLIATLTLLYATLIAGPMWLTRWRMQHLLADFQSIRPTQSTWADAQRLMTRWGKWGHYDGTCTPQSCDYVIIMNDPLSAMLGRSSEATNDLLNRLHIFPIAERLGWRGVRLYLGFTVRDGTILSPNIGLLLQVPEFADSRSAFPLSLGLGAQVRDRLRTGRPEFHRHRRSIWGDDEQLADHPDWKAGRPGGCEPNCEIGSVSYTPVLDHAELVRLTSYNLSCLTRVHPCTQLGDVLPAARDWNLYDDNPSPSAPPAATACHTDPRALGRDAEIILEVNVLSNKQAEEKYPDLRRDTIELANTRLVRVLKGTIGTKYGFDLLLTPYAGANYPPDFELPEHLVPGHRYFVLLDSDRRFELGELGAPRCGVLEATPENLRRLSDGITEDLKYRVVEPPED